MAEPNSDDSTSDEVSRARNRLTLITATLHADLGATFDPTGELLYLTDGSGRMLDEMTVLAAMADLVLRFNQGSTIAVPVTVPKAFEDIAKRHGGSVTYTRADRASLAQAATGSGDSIQRIPSLMSCESRLLSV